MAAEVSSFVHYAICVKTLASHRKLKNVRESLMKASHTEIQRHLRRSFGISRVYLICNEIIMKKFLRLRFNWPQNRDRFVQIFDEKINYFEMKASEASSETRNFEVNYFHH